jgi:peptidoglycan/LPS O-acetylase OafA/YrhL
MGRMGRRRLDVQGLRAVAVLSVVAYHAGLPVPGGFVGVDVFFVISGFVITAMLRREWEATGRISFTAFYKRRFKRLTPALAVVVAVTAVTAGLVMSPLGPQQRVSETGLGAMALIANWVIASTTGGYFDAPAATNPLLHTWSLSVEEQFYLVFPALLALGWFVAARRPARRHTASILVGVVALGSFGIALVGVNPFVHSWLFGFYSPLTRAWEFAVGALLALVAVKSVRGAAAAGALLLAASFFVIDDLRTFPGVWTLLPVAGTALLIVGRPRALTLRPRVRIGDWSYSIYLWHWPLIVFATTFGWNRTAAAALSFLPAVASFRWVERPLRSLQLPRRRFALLVAAVVMSPVIVDAALGAVATDVWTPRYQSGEMPVANRGDLGQLDFYRYMTARYHPCAAADIRAHSLRYGGFLRCRQSKTGSQIDVAVIGDSHAEHLFVGLADTLRDANVAYYLVDDAPVTSDPNFARIVRHVAATPSMRVVIVSAFWYARPYSTAALDATLQALTRAGKPTFVTDDVPFFPFDPFECKFRQALLLPTNCSTSAAAFQLEYETYYPQLAAAVRDAPGVQMLHTARFLCGRMRCEMARRGTLLYRDPIHLNVNGSQFVVEQLLAHYPRFAALAEHPVQH